MNSRTLKKKFVESTKLVCREVSLSYVVYLTLYVIELIILQFKVKPNILSLALW